MTNLIIVIERLLQAYERTTPSIDQGLVSRVQVCLKFCQTLQRVGL